MKNTTIIAIAGASASGKSLFAQSLYQQLSNELGSNGISIIHEDAYYRDQSQLELSDRVNTNYDHPDAFDHQLLEQHLHQLAGGKSIEMPQYCYKTHTRTNQTTTISPSHIILVEGILVLTNQALRDCFNIKVYIDTPLDICLIRRIERDTVDRGRTLASVTEQYLATVRPMFYQFIKPSKQWADIVVTRGGKNNVAIDILKTKIRQLHLQNSSNSGSQ
ncbi:uridine kinase [Thalassotalea sp. PLHSN55]|uniref:uridine kinase n=1 Tax=Thalassotalea sp. PLHSN55 TaxID=3435888 RepID=UPI003F827E8F